MIALDSDVLLVELRYRRDQRFAINRQVLDFLKSSGAHVAITCHTLLEVLGVACFNLAPPDLLALATQIPGRFGLVVFPNPLLNPEYARLDFGDIRDRIATRLSLGDAVTALQLEKYVSGASCLLSWNARHFQSKLAIPTLTPEEWWRQNAPSP